MKKSARAGRSRKQLQTNTRGGPIIAMATFNASVAIVGQVASLNLIVIDTVTGEPIATGANTAGNVAINTKMFAYRVNEVEWRTPSSVVQADGVINITSNEIDEWEPGNLVEITTSGFIPGLRGMGRAEIMPSMMTVFAS